MKNIRILIHGIYISESELIKKNCFKKKFGNNDLVIMSYVLHEALSQFKRFKEQQNIHIFV